MIFAEDLYAYFIIANNAKSYYGWNSKPLYFYCYGRGVTTADKNYTLERFEKICRHAEVVKLLKKYCELNNINAEIIIQKYKTVWLNQNVRVWIKNVEEGYKAQALDTMYKYWGKACVDRTIKTENKRFSKKSKTSLLGKLIDYLRK